MRLHISDPPDPTDWAGNVSMHRLTLRFIFSLIAPSDPDGIGHTGL